MDGCYRLRPSASTIRRDPPAGSSPHSQLASLTGRPIGSIAVNRRAVAAEREDAWPDAQMGKHVWSRDDALPLLPPEN